MEFELKDGWWDYFFSGVFAGLFAMIVMLVQVFESVGIRQFLMGVVFALLSVAIFLNGCRVKR